MKLMQRSGFVRGGLQFLLLVVVVALLYLSRRRSVDLDLAEAGKAVAGDLEQAAETVRETSEGAFLTAKVKTALALSKSAPAMDVDVDSDGGRVTLTGTVPSNESRVAILEVARETAGVVEVIDRIQVDPRVVPGAKEGGLAERLAELEIESAVYEQLLRAEGLDARWIRVRVDGGVVRLTGTVVDSAQKVAAASLVASVSGVAEVVNDLEVSHLPADET